uniref:vomeronasal type-2 receptor 116-like n=1 Tax=Jaculus jaculus TaxID=51337 RepID=UPI001E1B55BC
MQDDCIFDIYLQKEHIPEGFFMYLLNEKTGYNCDDNLGPNLQFVHIIKFSQKNENSKGLPIRRFQHVLALIFALEDINHNSKLLHNMSLQLHSISKICRSFSVFGIEDEFANLMNDAPNYMCEQKVCQIALIGPSWAGSARLGPLMQLYVRPQVTFFRFHPTLSDREKFPYLYQVAPKDTNLPLAMVSLMLHFIWTWVELFISDDDQGFQFLSNLRVEMQRYGICLAYVNMIPWFSKHSFDIDMDEEFYNIYNAVYAVAHDLHEMILQQVDSQRIGNEFMKYVSCTQLPSLCSVPCRPGFKKSRKEGQAACCFYCYWCPKNDISNETDMEQCVKCPGDQYTNVQQTHCLQKSVSYLSYEDPLGMTLACLVLTVLVLGVFWKHQDTPIVRANNRTLSYILLISLNCCYLCSSLFIGRSNTVTCIRQEITFGVLFTVAVSTVLAKTVTVVLAFKVTTPGRRMRGLLVSGAPNFIIPTCTLVQITLCAVWLRTSPLFIDTDAQSKYEHLIIICNKDSVTAFYCVLGYLGSLAIVSFTVAFLARNLPDTFNEAKFLTFSMLVFCSVWVTFLPVYQSSQGKFMVAVEVFSIQASSAGLLGCIFVPKCYIILLQPDRNSLHKVTCKINS